MKIDQNMNLTNKNKEKCKRGHKFTKENTRILKNGWRVCKECKKLHDKKFWSKPKNKIKRKKYLKEWRLNNLDKSRNNAIRAYNRVREIIEKAKNKPCIDCNIKYPHYVMDFDHIKGNKLINVGRTRSTLKTLKEIKKCEVVCSNCHRIRTWKNKKRKRISNVSN